LLPVPHPPGQGAEDERHPCSADRHQQEALVGHQVLGRLHVEDVAGYLDGPARHVVRGEEERAGRRHHLTQLEVEEFSVGHVRPYDRRDIRPGANVYLKEGRAHVHSNEDDVSQDDCADIAHVEEELLTHRARSMGTSKQAGVDS